MEDPARQKITLKGYPVCQKVTPKGPWPTVNMWRVGSENVLFLRKVL